MSRPLDSAHLHVTGRSEFVDDRPAQAGEVFVEVLYSPHARAQILGIDARRALAVPGVRGVFTARDLPHNVWGTIFKDQPVLADQEVQFVGESVALIAADSREAAARGRELVEVRYRALPAVLSIDEARRARSFIGHARTIERGDVESALRRAPRTLQGKVILRGAEHFYLENQAAVAYPLEDGQIEVHSSSQHPTEVQHVVAHTLGIPDKDVVCIVKRMGGAFGGKESQAAPYAAYAAFVAQRLGVPARVVLNKDDDMICTGKRNPFENEYRVGFDDTGQILALDVALFSDGGAYADLSTSIMERAMLHCDNAYYIPAFRTVGQVCRTNTHPHTAFRGFGGPKGVAVIERVIEEIAHALKIDPLDVRQRNCYTSEGGRDVAPYGQRVENNCLPELFARLERDCDYRARRREIAREQRLPGALDRPLRGLSLTAVKFGISFTTRFLNQANALVIIHRDGSLQISTGATEMGQGVNTRIAELVTAEFGLDRDSARVMPTATDKNANTSPTAASSGTDLNGAAALIAARRLKARLSALAVQLSEIPPERWPHLNAGIGSEPELTVAPESEQELGDAAWPLGAQDFHGVVFEEGRVRYGSWSCRFGDLVNEAYYTRLSLTEYAHYKFPGLSFNKETGRGQAFLYFTQGVAASEVEIDRCTGEAKVRRVDILMDLGRPINRDLDLGQVTGGFVQGQGWMTTEKLVYNDSGALLAHAPSTYKIPGVHDMPRDFRVELLPNDGNRVNVAGTKAVGEPPLLLSLSVWTAIHDALKDLPGYEDRYPDLEVPATQEEILRAIVPDAFRNWEKG